MSTAFVCPDCQETFAPHWRADDRSGLCRSCANARAGRCQFADHPTHGHPCSYGIEAPGEPCRYCARPVPADGTACPHCWQSLEGLTMADLKAIFAEMDLDLAHRPS